MSIIITDVYYREDGTARAAAIKVSDFRSTEPLDKWTVEINHVEDYVPGSFYLRELPCLMKLFEQLTPKDLFDVEYFITDSYTHFGKDRPGLGEKLWEAMGKRIPVIGIAKTKFISCEPGIVFEIMRGDNAKNPLWVTAIGLRKEEELLHIVHGIATMPDMKNRKPDLVKMTDHLSRNIE